MDTMAEKTVESRAAKTVREVFASGRPLTYVMSSEEQRVSRVLQEVGQRLNIPVWTWSQTESMPGRKRLARRSITSLRSRAAEFFTSRIFTKH